jgi:peptidoglycan pentaglycine glycine transferase (the first glycine)
MELKELTHDLYIQHARNLNPLQSWEWGEVKSPEWTPIRFGIYEGKNIVFVGTLLVKKMPIIKAKFGYIPRLLYIPDSSLFIKILTEIKHFAQKRNLSHILIDPDVNFTTYLKNKGDVHHLFSKLGFTPLKNSIQPQRTIVLDLLKSEKELLASMRSKHRQYIKKSYRNGISIQQGEREDLENFCSIMKQISTERGYVMHSTEYYKKVWNYFSRGENILLFLAYKTKIIVGAYMILLNKENAFEMYGGCNQEGNRLLANYSMKWEAIQHCKKIGKNFYDQWGAEYLYPGLIQFKEGFGGNVIEYPPSFLYRFDKIAYSFFQLADNINKLRQKLI